MIPKTEFLIITPSFLKQKLDDLNIMVGDSNIVSSNSAHNLGVIIIFAVFVNQLIFICVDYCNAILYGLPDNSLYGLQKIENTAERILARLPRCFHISASLFDLH